MSVDGIHLNRTEKPLTQPGTPKNGTIGLGGRKKCKKHAPEERLSCMTQIAAIILLLLWSPGAGLAAGSGTAKGSLGSQERQAIERTLQLLQESARQWLTKTGCASCHHQTLESMTVTTARAKRFKLDDSLVADQQKRIERDLINGQQRMLNAIRSTQPVQVGPNPEMIYGYLLLGFAETGVPPGPLTDTAVRYLLSLQEKSGNWRCRVKQRPPLEASDFAATALMIRAAFAYAPSDRKEESRKAIAHAVGWLRTSEPSDTEDRTFRLFGLYWAGAESTSIAEAGRDLLAHQRADGGWSQTTTQESDAYATAESLVALREAGIVHWDTPQFRKGIKYLLRNRETDGSWHVTSRAIPIQEYFESGFPHGKDQFISYAATCWATLALLSDRIPE